MFGSSALAAVRARAVPLATVVVAMALIVAPSAAAPGGHKADAGPNASSTTTDAPAVQAPAADLRVAKQKVDVPVAAAVPAAAPQTKALAKQAEKAAKKADSKKPDVGPAVVRAAQAATAAVDAAASATAAPLPAATPSPASAPTPAPTPAAAPVAQAPAPSPAGPLGAVRPVQRRTSSNAARRARSIPARPVPVAASTPSAAPAPGAVAPKPAGRAPRSTTRPRKTTRSPLRRTVVRVLEVIPPAVRIALAVLVALGLALATAAAVQARRARRLERQRRRLVADVGLLQSALLPVLPGRIGDARVSAAYRPAEGLAAGGDFYDAFEVPGGRTAVIVGDVAGHGRDVVPITALVRYSLRAYLDAGLAPRTALQVAAAVLEPQLGERLVTVVVAVVDPTAGRLTYACAGHPPPMFAGIDFDPITACSSPPIGAGVPTGLRQTTVAITPGVVACFTSDGLADARVGDGRLGPHELDSELQALDRGAHADELLARVVRRTDAQPDDMAVCMVGSLVGPPGPRNERVEEFELDRSSIRDGRARRFMAACGVLPYTAIEVLRQAEGAIVRTGSAVVSVRSTPGAPRVKVTPRPAVELPLVGVAA